MPRGRRRADGHVWARRDLEEGLDQTTTDAAAAGAAIAHRAWRKADIYAA